MAAPVTAARSIAYLDIRNISPNPAQPRRQFAEDAIDSLAESISEHGLLSPILVRRINAGRYELIAGERRLRALKKLGRPYAEALIMPAYDSESAVMALIENLQREQLHYLDEAEACRAILDGGGLTQEQLARKLGRSPSALANRLRLIRLPRPAPVIQWVTARGGVKSDQSAFSTLQSGAILPTAKPRASASSPTELSYRLPRRCE